MVQGMMEKCPMMKGGMGAKDKAPVASEKAVAQPSDAASEHVSHHPA